MRKIPEPEVVQRFARNTAGRDFVVGDIHGCFDQLQVALENVHFDPRRDRCFSVGDLVDRGPDSHAALHWLAHPWFHACLGNHEEMLLLAANDRGARSSWIAFCGGEWWVHTDAIIRTQFCEVIARLPLAMEIETEFGCVGIVHADVPSGRCWQEFIAALKASDEESRHVALWSRQRAMGRVATSVSGVERVVCGHTIRNDRKVHAAGNVWFIDTGAYLQDDISCLTLLELSALF